MFTAQSGIEAGKAFYADVKGRMQKLGRNPDHLKIQPACFVVVGDTVEEAKAKRAKLDSLVNYANSIASLSIALGTDASKFDPDGPLPEIPDSNASKSGRERAIAAAKRDNLTVRQLAQRMGGYSGLAMVGTPKTIADEMEEWIETNASDGFTIMFPYLPGGLDDFVRGVIPELQRRGLFRREYEGKTLRENLGIAAAGEPLLRSQQIRGGRIDMSEIENFHAHVYYDAPTRAQAQKLCEAAGQKFGVKVGRMHDNPVGPHPRGSCQLTIGKEQFTDVVSWLVLNRSGLTVFTHAQTGNALKDHTDHVIWLGPSETLELDQFR